MLEVCILFPVKSIWRVKVPSEVASFASIWRVKVPTKVVSFTWTAAWVKIPTKDYEKEERSKRAEVRGELEDNASGGNFVAAKIRGTMVERG